MKPLYLVVLLAWICPRTNVHAQHATELKPGYYIVVGAYAASRENVAQNYTEVLNRRGYPAAYGFNTSRNFFFVYLNYFEDLKTSLKDMQATRKRPDFAQAWVRVVPGDIAAARATPSSAAQKEEPIKPAPESVPAVDQSSQPVVSTTSSVLNAVPVGASSDGMEITENEPIKQYDPVTLGNTEVFLSLYNATNNRIIDGVIKVIDTDRAKVLKEVKGNEYLTLPDPKSKSGQLTMVCEAFGYRKVQQEINYPLPLADTVKEHIDFMGTTFVVNFDLVRYHRGDMATLNNVSFYNDAALMLPASKDELNSLVQMMQENPKYRIRLHGHTNGNYHGRIITLGENKNFFSLEGSRSGVGSAKDLAFNRANVIREYLAANGVDPARVDVKSWGGKRPLYDKHGVNAKRNVRVEVEILED